MSDLKSAPVAESALVYRPLSGLAIASVVVASGFAVVLLVLGSLAVIYGEPLPLGTWTLIFPVTAAVLALSARRQIARSEGTRSGQALAGWGWWLSILFGLGYFAIYAGTYLAVTYQAREFSNGFMTLLRQGKLNHAFLLTQDPDQRQSDSPDNEKLMAIRYGVAPPGQRSPLASFREHELVRLIRQGGPDVTIRDLGMNNWEYDKGYHFVQTFRITTPEGVFDATLGLRSVDSRKMRRWRLVPNEMSVEVSSAGSLTPLGEVVRKWRQESLLFVNAWLHNRALGNLDAVYLFTREPAEHLRIVNEYQMRVLVGNVAALGSVVGAAGQDSIIARLPLLVHPEFQRTAFLPGFQEFAAGRLIEADRLEAPRKFHDMIVRDAKKMFRYGTNLKITVPESNKGTPDLSDKAPDRFRVWHNLNIEALEMDGSTPTPKYHCGARVLVESGRMAISPEQTPQWRVVGIQLLEGNEGGDPSDPRRQQMRGGMPPHGSRRTAPQ